MNHFAEIAARLAEEELDAVLLTGEYNRFYASGFHSTGGDGVAVVTRNGNYYFTDSRYIEAAETQVQDAAIGMTDREKPYPVWINEAIDLSHVKRMGFEDDTMTVAEYRMYAEKLHCELVPASDFLHRLRRVKDAEEIGRLIDAQRIAEGALDQILKEIRVGMTEQEIAARLQYLMLAGGAEKMSFDPIVASGPNGSMPHAVPTDRRIREGEFITMDFGCVYRGYCSDMTRTVAVGHVTEEMDKVYHTVLQAQLAGIAAAKAGVTGREVDAAARKVIEDAGYGPYFGHSFGHGVGVEIHEYPNAAPSNDQPLPAGAVISAEPGIYIPGKFGVRIEDVIVIGEDGCRDITEAGKALLIL
jgi:Xaa-Pro aminopeptidase